MSNAQVTSLFTARETMTRTMKNIENSATRLDRAFGSMRGRMRAAFEFNLVNRGMDLFWRGVNNIVDALPDMIHRGERWAETIDAITDATGLSAQQASELAAVNQRVGGSNDSLTRGFAALAKSVYTSRDAWKTMGVAVALNRDGSVDAYRTFQNLRRAISDTGGSLLSTAAAQTALARGGKDLLDLLQLKDRQYRLLAQDARASGQIMTAEALAAAENWSRAQARIGGVLDGLGTQLLGRLAPLLTRFADGFSSWIQRNMDNIVRLVVGAANTVLTVVGDLLGIDLGGWSFTEQVGHAADETLRLGTGLKDMSKAHDKASTATAGHTSAVKALRDAQRDLARLQASGVGFTGDKSRYEQERARQARLAEIADAQQRVKDARKALADISKGATAAGVHAGAAWRGGFQKGARSLGKSGKGGAVPDLFGGLEQVLQDSSQTGHDIANAIKTAIFGDAELGMRGGMVVTVRKGGLVGALQGVQTGMQKIADIFGPVVDKLGLLQSYYSAILKPFQLAAEGLGTAAGLLMSARDLLQKLFDSLPGWLIGERNPAPYSGWRSDGPDMPRKWPNPNQNPDQFPAPGTWVPDWDKVPKNLGFGLSDPFGITMATVFRTWMGPSSDVVMGLSDATSAIRNIPGSSTDAPPPNTGGDSLRTLAARVSVVESVNKGQTGRLDSQAKSLNAYKAAEKVLWGAQGRQDRGQNARIAGVKAVNSVQAYVLTGHEKRIKSLENGSGGRSAADTAHHTRRTASTSDQMLNVLKDIRGELRGGGRRHGTSSLRANP